MKLDKDIKYHLGGVPIETEALILLERTGFTPVEVIYMLGEILSHTSLVKLKDIIPYVVPDGRLRQSIVNKRNSGVGNLQKEIAYIKELINFDKKRRSYE